MNEAINELSPNIFVTPKSDEKFYELSKSLSEFIELVHERLNLSYEHMFDKYPIDNFVNDFGFVLGEYDIKLAKAHLL